MKREQLLKVVEAADLLGVTPQTVRNMLKDGRLHTVKNSSGQEMIPRDAVLTSYRLLHRHKLSDKLDKVTEYVTSLEARISLLEDILTSRDEEEDHSEEELMELQKIAKNELQRTFITYEELEAWASDLNKIGLDEANIVGIKLLYLLIEHLITLFDVAMYQAYDISKFRTRDLLIIAKHKMIGFSVVGNVQLNGPNLTSLVMTRLSGNN